jgi:acetyltransferase-like isoleucine patch superfamily enzyme
MARALFDALAALLFCVLIGASLALMGFVSACLGALPPVPWWHWFLIPVLGIIFLLSLLVVAAIIRLLLPPIKVGRYPFPRHFQSFVWLLHFSLQRLLYLPVWRHFMFSSSTLRWGLLRALGAKAAYSINTSSDVYILDLPLIELQADAMIGAGSTLSGHVIENDTLLLGKIKVGRGAQIGSNVLIGPGTVIGRNAVVGPDCRIAPDVTIGEFAYLGAACYVSAGVVLGDNALLGHQVSIEPNVKIGAGAVVRNGVRVPRGTVIADGVHFPAHSEKETA